MSQLTLPERASTAIQSANHQAAIVALLDESKSIVEVKDKAGREQCHSALMTLVRTRTEIAKVGKAARDDATAFSKAVIAEESRLTALLTHEESRLRELRDEWDAKIEAEKKAKIAAEQQRIAGIKARIQEIHDLARVPVGTASSAVMGIIRSLSAVEIDESFAEFQNEAAAAKTITGKALAEELTRAEKAEAEQARIAAERAELAKLRAEAAEREREQAAKLAAERAEAQKKIDDENRIAKAARDEADRIAREAREAEAAKLKAEQEAIRKQQAEIAAEKAKAEKVAADRARAESEREAKRIQRIREASTQMLQALEAVADCAGFAALPDDVRHRVSLAIARATVNNEELV